MKSCTKCKTNERREGHSWCKPCLTESSARWRRNNRGYCNDYARTRSLTVHSRAWAYGIDQTDYTEIFEKQGRRCAICKSSTPKRKSQRWFCIDHDHNTGEVRGLLCNDCNVAIGRFDDSVEILESARNYLLNPPARGRLE